MNEYDPSKAEIGVLNRQPYMGGAKTSNSEVGFDAQPVDSLWEADPEYEKQAEEVQIPPDSAVPRFPPPKPGGVEDQSAPKDLNVDLDPHGSHEAPDPPAKQLVMEKIRNMRLQVANKEKAVLQKQIAQQERDFKSRQQEGTDVEVDRRRIEPGFPSTSAFRKTAETVLNILEDDAANPIHIMLVLDTKWGPEWKDWEPETILQTAEDEAVNIARVNMDKIMSVKVLAKRDDFWTDPRTFEKVCLAFAGKMVDWGNIQQPRIHEIAGCVALVERYIREEGFSDDVAAYVAGAAIRDGFILLPPVLSFANFPFSTELALTMGDVALGKQEQLMEALNKEDVQILENPEDGVQYMRLLRCQYHIQDMIDSAKA